MNLARLFQPSKRHQRFQGLFGTNERRAALIGFASGVLSAYAGYYWASILAFIFTAFEVREMYLRKKAGNWPKSKLFWFI